MKKLPAVFLFLAGTPALAINIEVDYRYDSNNFFSAAGNPDWVAARAALEAAAARWSAIIDQSLGAVNLANDDLDARIGFQHPGTGGLHFHQQRELVIGVVADNAPGIYYIPIAQLAAVAAMAKEAGSADQPISHPPNPPQQVEGEEIPAVANGA